MNTMNFNCYLCNEFFSRRENLQRHHRTYHLNETAKRYTCSLNNEHVDCSPNLPPVTEKGITRRISTHAFGKFTRNIRSYYAQKYRVWYWDLWIDLQILPLHPLWSVVELPRLSSPRDSEGIGWLQRRGSCDCQPLRCDERRDNRLWSRQRHLLRAKSPERSKHRCPSASSLLWDVHIACSCR